jgi:hypothetical protein
MLAVLFYRLYPKENGPVPYMGSLFTEKSCSDVAQTCQLAVDVFKVGGNDHLDK